MSRPIPVGGTHLHPDLVAEFFAVFTRFEFALKLVGYVRKGEVRHAESAWWSFAEDASQWLSVTTNPELSEVVAYLVASPPRKQLPDLTWEDYAPHGATDIEKALDAACQVRNNLFHGGKHGEHADPERDGRLVSCALVLLRACIEQCAKLRAAYESGDRLPA